MVYYAVFRFYFHHIRFHMEGTCFTKVQKNTTVTRCRTPLHVKLHLIVSTPICINTRAQTRILPLRRRTRPLRSPHWKQCPGAMRKHVKAKPWEQDDTTNWLGTKRFLDRIGADSRSLRYSCSGTDLLHQSFHPFSLSCMSDGWWRVEAPRRRAILSS